MNLRAPEPLGPGHDAAGFDCGIAALNGWLRRQAPAHEGSRSTTFVVADDDGRVAGFYGLSAGTARSGEATPRLHWGVPEPVLKLGRLAVARAAQGQGLGTALVIDAFVRTFAVSRHAPVAALLADAPDAAAAGWLRGLGFQPVPGDATAMFCALGTIEELVERQGRSG